MSVLALTALPMGCTEPQFLFDEDGAIPPRDAGLPNAVACRGRECDASQDQNSPPDIPLPGVQPQSWAESLSGHYAMRARYFGVLDDGGNVAHEAVTVATITIDPTNRAVTMTTKLCRETSEVFSDGKSVQKTSVKWPLQYPPRVYALSFDSTTNFWTASKPDTLVGYLDKLDPCARTARAWLGGMSCECSGDASPPVAPNDCRVTDSDVDLRVGISLVQEGAVNGDEYVVQREASQLIHGTIDRTGHGRHTALITNTTATSPLQCVGHACERKAEQHCQVDNNLVEFVQIFGGTTDGSRPAWTCDDVSRVGLFTDKVDFPKECNAGSASATRAPE